ncbi:MAG: Holliday junction branch migration protein RuvA [Desulfobulbus sp.]|jgi:Holliday junction DNA helicase RuvA|uniref:Holliday junction branch migration protein RuvA n=1 Tax=Desulfobulbus sp. TaxID=895 RepID=UPI002848FF5A|nr:Holliday junction branch migration protein RuvA [Desulfobulbus sp.]MDR2548842.1 Holliday junction branch migration protein RuvA [Desulfobulbus sp.]
MIASLSGLVLVKTPNAVIVDVGGVGYEAFVSGRTYDALPETGHACFLHVQTVVREDAIHLFGFHTKEEKDLFLLLITVSGIGPRLAQTILSGIGVDELCRAITGKDLSRLTALPGIGKKTAQRICVDLAEKVGGLGGFPADAGGARPQPAPAGEADAMSDAVSALVNLGYPQATAWQALRAVEQQLGEGAAPLKVEELLRQALRFLAAR